MALFAEVSSRALKAVRRQKYQIHRRARPERLASLITLAANGESARLGNAASLVDSMLSELEQNFGDFLKLIDDQNARQNGKDWTKVRKDEAKLEVSGPAAFAPAKNYLLPMAFPEGSPMHPAYGAGHATVAGACVTVLKAFFKTVDPLNAWQKTPMSEVNNADLQALGVGTLSVEGELNKLAANISIGRDFAGVHYYSDYYESLRLGERVAIGILHEQMTNYNEPVSMYLHSFDNERIEISTDGKGKVELKINGDAANTAAWWVKNTGVTGIPNPSNWVVA